MSDTFSRKKRRKIMQAVRQERTSSEQKLAELLDEAGIEYVQNKKNLPGKPDFLLTNFDLIVFVHGCFWHGHDRCSKGRTRPKSNRVFWKEKIEGNQDRDRRKARQLRNLGYSVFTVWECELRSNQIPARLSRRICC